MPELAFELSFLLYFWLQVLSPRLKQESHLSAHAEVWHNQNWEFSEERVSAELHLVICLLKKVFHADRLDLHNIADVEVINPLILIQKPKHTTHVWLFFLQVLILIQRIPFNSLILLIRTIFIRWTPVLSGILSVILSILLNLWVH